MYFSKWKFYCDASSQSNSETNQKLGHEHISHLQRSIKYFIIFSNLRDLPHGVVDVVLLAEEEDEVPAHVEEVGHERYLRDWQPEAPGKEIIDDTTVSSAAGKSYPEQAEAPGRLAESIVRG